MTPPRRAELALAACVWLALPRVARADTCVARTEAFHREGGLFPAETQTRFLDAEEVVVLSFAGLERCVRLDVIPHADDLELFAALHDDAGVLLARVASTSPSPAVSACGVRGTVHLALEVSAGRGRVDVVASEGRVPGPAGPAPCAAGTPGIARGRYEVPVQATRAEDVLRAAIGDERASEPVRVESQGRARVTLPVDGCRVLLVATEAERAEHVLAEADGPNGRTLDVLAHGRAVPVLACAREGGIALDLESAGPARFAVASLDVRVDGADVPSGLEGDGAAAMALLSARARDRGLTEVARAVSLSARDPWVFPVTISAGACALVATATTVGGVSLRLVAADGTLLALDTAGASAAHAWHCADRAETFYAWVRGLGAERRRVFAVTRSQPSSSAQDAPTRTSRP